MSGIVIRTRMNINLERLFTRGKPALHGGAQNDARIAQGRGRLI